MERPTLADFVDRPETDDGGADDPAAAADGPDETPAGDPADPGAAEPTGGTDAATGGDTDDERPNEDGTDDGRRNDVGEEDDDQTGVAGDEDDRDSAAAGDDDEDAPVEPVEDEIGGDPAGAGGTDDATTGRSRTFEWRPDRQCSACGEVVGHAWRGDAGPVCAACKSW